MRRLILAFVALAPICGFAWAQCEATLPVREILERSMLLDEADLSKVERDVQRLRMLKEGLAAHPHDYRLLQQLMSLETENQDQRLAWAEARLKESPDRPAYAILYAQALVGRNTPRAIEMFEEIQTAHPASEAGVQAHLDLAGIFSFGKFRDKPRAQKELGKFLEHCPAPLNWNALHAINREGSPEQIARAASGVRERLEAHYEPLFRNDWESLWRLEFKARPLAEHDALREQIARDLEKLEARGAERSPSWLSFLRSGYESANDLEAMTRGEEELLASHPASPQAKRIVQSRWRSENPFPSAGGKEEREAYFRALFEATDQWRRRWPNDSMILNERFGALAALPDTTPEQISAAADLLLESYRRNPIWWQIPPVEIYIADQFVKHSIRLDEVPGLVAEGYDSLMSRESDGAADDRYEAGEGSSRAVFLLLTRARVMLEYYAATGQGEKAAEIEAELESVDASSTSFGSTLLARRARAAEVAGRKLDAVMLYREAIASRTSQPAAGAEDVLIESVERLWKELGGSDATLALLLERSRITEATSTRWERKNTPLPEFELTDLQGETWSLGRLQGKVTLINVWATWCGPCRLEHPEFQKLYDKLKDRTDVTVLTFNVDDDVGKVAPYIQQHEYGFPVVLAGEVVEEVAPALSIPRNWFVNPRTILEWEKIGFGSDPQWLDSMIEKLEEVLQQKGDEG